MIRKCWIVPVLLLMGQAPPAGERKGAAMLSGTITAADPIIKIVAVDRAWADVLKVTQNDPKDDFVYPGTVDAKTGEFKVTGLLEGRKYDLIVWTKKEGAKEAVRWEGVAMDYHKDVNPVGALTQEDKDWLTKFVEKTPRFEDKCRILWLAADHGHATALVELARTTEFHSGKGGEIIVRMELWYFENYFGGWAMDNNTEKVMDRWRGNGDTFPEAWQFVPALGGLAAGSEGKAEALKVTLPQKVDEKRGPGRGEWVGK